MASRIFFHIWTVSEKAHLIDHGPRMDGGVFSIENVHMKFIV